MTEAGTDAGAGGRPYEHWLALRQPLAGMLSETRERPLGAIEALSEYLRRESSVPDQESPRRPQTLTVILKNPG
jgi:hypothetical protein